MRSLLSALLFCGVAATTVAEDRPNIILIVANDMGRDWISCYGGEYPTPNIDRLAEQGIRYQIAWGTPEPALSQSVLLTGQYPFRQRWTGKQVVSTLRRHHLSPSTTITFARTLRSAGYETAVGGLWQVNDLRNDTKLLAQHGFDHHCVWVPEAAGPQATPGAGNLLFSGAKQSTGQNSHKTVNSFLIEFIRRIHEKPILIYYSLSLPGTLGPSAIAPSGSESSDASTEFKSNVARADNLIGNLVRAVVSSRKGRGTIIIFTSGNGSPIAGTLDGKPFQKGKGIAADVGVHVPFIVRGPVVAGAGRWSRDLIDFTDLFPTLLELAKLPVPEGLSLDGRSIVPSLTGSEDPYKKRNWIFSQLGEFRMIRDWQHILDTSGGFHDLSKDPLQQSPVSPLDKIAPGRKQRLEMILNRMRPKPSP